MLFKLIEDHFSPYKNPRSVGGEDIYVPTSICFRVGQFNISAHSTPVSGAKKYLTYSVLTHRVNCCQSYRSFKEKDFFKMLKNKEKEKYLFYMITTTKEVPDNTLKCAAYLFLDDALKNTDSKNKCVYGVKESGKYSCLAKVRKDAKPEKFWKLRKRE